MTAQNIQPENYEQAQKKDLEHRLDSIGWALFLIMIGGLWLMPDGTVPEGTWVVGVGVIMLGISAVRYSNGIQVSNFTVILGVIALCSGVSGFLGVELPWFPVLIILIGASTIFRVLVEQK